MELNELYNHVFSDAGLFFLNCSKFLLDKTWGKIYKLIDKNMQTFRSQEMIMVESCPFLVCKQREVFSQISFTCIACHCSFEDGLERYASFRDLHGREYDNAKHNCLVGQITCEPWSPRRDAP